MIYLDEDIKAGFPYLYDYHNTFADYEVSIPNIPTEHNVFQGRVFIGSYKGDYNWDVAADTLFIYLNDIIESMVNSYWDLDQMTVLGLVNPRSVIDFKLLFNVNVSLKLNDGTVQTKTINDVCAIYRYPNEKRPELPSVSSSRDLAYVVLDGFDIETGKYALLPRYPINGEGKSMNFWLYTFNNTDFQSLIWIYSNDTKIKTQGSILAKGYRHNIIGSETCYSNFMYDHHGSSNMVDTINPDSDVYLATTINNALYKYYVIRANGLQPNIQEQEAENILFHEFGMTEDEVRDAMADITAGVPTIIYQTKSHLPNVSDEEYLEWQSKKGLAGGYFKYTSGASYVPEPITYRIGNIDVCMERYYLYWVDRLGGVQCQPFKQNPVFKEKIERTMIKNQYGQKRLGVADITPKWELKSSWITEEEYPYYESLLVSPKVILYDTEREKYIKVNVIDTDYTEKTHKNQNGNLLNFNITVEENKNQRIIH